MAEYLAPGVYIEEVDTGPKPIEGVSTSTAGMVGMTERGPTDIPILITSVGEFDRWFGGILDENEFVDATGRRHCYLPHAVEGFFTNGGKRLYAVRVTPAEAQRAEAEMFWADPTVIEGQSVLLRAAAQGSGILETPLANTIPLYVISDANIALGDSLRIGDGSSAEYVTISTNANAIAANVTHHIPLNAPASWAHAATGAIREHAPTPVSLPAANPPTPQLNAAATAGSTDLFVECGDDLAAFAAGPPPAADRLPWLAQLSLDGLSDLVVVTAVEPAGMTSPPAPAPPVPISRLILNQPLQGNYPAGRPVTIIRSEATTTRTLKTDVTPGDLMVFGNGNVGATAIIELDRGQPQHEAFLRGALVTLTFTPPLPFTALPGTMVREVTVADAAVPAKATTAAASAGAQTLSLDNRDGLVVGALVRIGAPALEEYATIVAIPGDPAPAPNPGTVTLSQPLARDHGVNTQVQPQNPLGVPGAPQPTARLYLPAARGSTTALATDGPGWAVGRFAQLQSPEGDIAIVRMTAASALVQATTIALTTNLGRMHSTGEIVAERQQLFDIQALDAGAWGNRLRISVENETRGLATTTTGTLTPPLQFAVGSLTGLEAGSLIELRNPTNGATALLKVRRIDRTAGTVILDPPGLNAAALAALGPITTPLEVRSREFKLTVLLRRRPDPAVPSRNDQIQATEVFPHLSMDHRHSRYFQRVIGAINGPPRLEDNRPDGESDFIRVLDSLVDTATEVIRPGPETLVDILPGNIIRPARRPLTGGDDSLVTMTSAQYLGSDNIEPRLRTGLECLRNLPEVSLVAVPGQTQPEIQIGLIAHCEAMRYRFAILDSDSQNSSIAQVRLQRQQFDTKYAALYYPWLTIPDPMPDNLANIGIFELPPSGHVLGLIARVDNERGVHKAPANEVVRGITGITRILQKAEHEILNPSPVNVNVIRDFRPDGRSIRLFGARCITSDQEHKYVNVRRLLIFLEQSIERGLQWVVFEPNAEPLWARVTQSVSNFLTDVWRAGALEGVEPSEGYFVKCDRTTMTQSEIDNGQLIVVIGVAPVKPAEFVIIRIGLSTRTAEAA